MIGPGMARLWADRGGAVAIIVAVVGMVLVLTAGVVFDIARTVRIKQALQQDIDRAAMSAAAVAYAERPGEAPNEAAMSAAMRRYLGDVNERVPGIAALAAPRITYNRKPRDDVTVTMDADIETAFLKILNIDEIPVEVKATAKRPEPGPMELALVLDRTWSMSAMLGGVQKSVTLRNAATMLVDRLMTTDNAKVGVVPFATWINVEQSLWTQSWLSVPATQTSSWTSCSYPNAKGCITPSFQSTCITDGLSMPCTRWGTTTCTSWGDKVCKTYTSISSFGGCLGVRSSKRDTIIDPTNPKYPGILGTCAQTPILDLTSRSDLGGRGVGVVKTRISQLTPVLNGQVTETFIPGGLVWGWNMLTSEMPLTRASTPAEAKARGISKVLVLMTDGDNTVRPSGASFVGQSPPTEADALTENLCRNIKADGILIFTVAFTVDNARTQTMLRNCASRPDYFYLANNSLELESAFNQIGTSLTRLRLIN